MRKKLETRQQQYSNAESQEEASKTYGILLENVQLEHRLVSTCSGNTGTLAESTTLAVETARCHLKRMRDDHRPQGSHYRFAILALVYDKRNEGVVCKDAAELLTEMEGENEGNPKEDHWHMLDGYKGYFELLKLRRGGHETPYTDGAVEMLKRVEGNVDLDVIMRSKSDGHLEKASHAASECCSVVLDLVSRDKELQGSPGKSEAAVADACKTFRVSFKPPDDATVKAMKGPWEVRTHCKLLTMRIKIHALMNGPAVPKARKVFREEVAPLATMFAKEESPDEEKEKTFKESITYCISGLLLAHARQKDASCIRITGGEAPTQMMREIGKQANVTWSEVRDALRDLIPWCRGADAIEMPAKIKKAITDLTGLTAKGLKEYMMAEPKA